MLASLSLMAADRISSSTVRASHYGPIDAMKITSGSHSRGQSLGADPTRARADAAPHRAGEAHIINVCSIFGLVPMRKAAANQTSKHGLVGSTTPHCGSVCQASVRRDRALSGICETRRCLHLSRRARRCRSAAARHSCARSPEKVAAKALPAIRRNRSWSVVSPAARSLWDAGGIRPDCSTGYLREGWRRKGPPLAASGPRSGVACAHGRGRGTTGRVRPQQELLDKVLVRLDRNAALDWT